MGDFQAQLERVLCAVQVVLVLVTPAPAGPDLSETGGIDRSKLSSMEAIVEHDKKGWTDWCRVEMEMALSMNKVVIPVYPGSKGNTYIGEQLGKLATCGDHEETKQKMEEMGHDYVHVGALRSQNAYPLHEDIYNSSVEALVDGMERKLKSCMRVHPRIRTLPPCNFVFVGNPGAGKSTLLNAICGEVLFRWTNNIDDHGDGACVHLMCVFTVPELECLWAEE